MSQRDEQARPESGANRPTADVEEVVGAVAYDLGAEDAREIVLEQSHRRPAEANPVLVPRAANDEAGTAPEQPLPPPRSSALREAARLLGRLRGAPERAAILLLTLGIVAETIINMLAQVRLNTWHGDFFDAIEKKDLPVFGQQLIVFVAIVAGLLVLVVAETWMREFLKIRMREWLTNRLLAEWLAPGRAYRMAMAGDLGVNPDQRIQEDTRLLTELSTELGIGLLGSTLFLISFMGILWSLSDQVVFPIGGEQVVIPGYMVWCAIAYALLGSLLTWKVGYPLIDLNAQRYQREAELRFALVRVNESMESVSLYGGESDERQALSVTAGTVIAAMRRLSSALSRLTWITSGYGWLAIVVPIIVAAPGYFGGDLTLGGLMMVVGAFNQVQQALRWFVDNFPRIADWRAALARVSRFHDALGHIDAVDHHHERIELAQHPRGGLAFEHVGVLLADGHAVIDEATTEIRPGERVLIVGESGSGKSTLFRAMAGLWPWGHGRILLPPRSTMMFMPQRPYLPLGTLRNAVAYPAAPADFAEEEIHRALARVGLEDFAGMLDADERWDKAMSLGQQQRLAFARLLLHKPIWVFLDEATAALDDENQARVMSIFDEELPNAAVVSIGHRPGLEDFHSRTLQLVPSKSGARLRLKPPPRYRMPGEATLIRLLGRRLVRASPGPA